MEVKLVRVTENPIMACAEAASNCYDSEPNEKIVDSCYQSGHTSVLEFADFHFHLEGISRVCSHQLVRHRLSSFAQKSQRYVEESGFKYVTPPSIKNNRKASEVYGYTMEYLQKVYDYLISIDIPPEDARFVLSNSCETTIDVKMNLRTLIHFMNERLCNKAQWEIRQLAQEMKKLVVDKYPELEKFLVPKCEANTDCPFCTEKKSCKKHPKLEEIYKAYYSK